MDEIRALRDTNRAKDSALRDEHKVLEGMEMSVKDAMAAAREERVRRQEEAERKAKAIAKAKVGCPRMHASRLLLPFCRQA